MKKLAYLGVLAGLLLTGCIAGDYGIKPADPQSWEQEAAVTLPAAAVAAGVEAIDLAAVEGDSVAVATLTPLAVEDCDFKYTIVLDDTYKFSAGADMKVSVADLQTMVEEVYGKRPTARTFNAIVNVDVMVNGQASLVVSNDFEVVITPKAPFIDNAYYLVGDMASWDAAGALKFNHSGKDVYEDSEFTIVFTTPKENCYWKIIPGGNYAGDFWAEGVTGVVGVAVDGDPALEGTLVTEKPQAGKIEKAAMYKMTINMMDYTYRLEELNFVEYIYVPGNHQGWNPGTAPALWGANFDGKYTGFSQLSTGGFKFTQERAWAAEYNSGSFNTLPDGFTGDGNIYAAKDAHYYIVADVANGVLKATEITTWGIIGPAQAGGWDTDTDMTWDATKGCWAIADVTLSAGEMKFRANDAWDVNVGGSFDNLVENGGNIAVEAGTYDIELYLERTDSNKAYAVLTKK